jgi:hypothetical protein
VRPADPARRPGSPARAGRMLHQLAALQRGHPGPASWDQRPPSSCGPVGVSPVSSSFCVKTDTYGPINPLLTHISPGRSSCGIRRFTASNASSFKPDKGMAMRASHDLQTLGTGTRVALCRSDSDSCGIDSGRFAATSFTQPPQSGPHPGCRRGGEGIPLHVVPFNVFPPSGPPEAG